MFDAMYEVPGSRLRELHDAEIQRNTLYNRMVIALDEIHNGNPEEAATVLEEALKQK